MGIEWDPESQLIILPLSQLCLCLLVRSETQRQRDRKRKAIL